MRFRIPQAVGSDKNKDRPARLNPDNATPTSNIQPIRWLDPGCQYNFTHLMTYPADPDELASSNQLASSRYTLLANAGHFGVQQGQG